MCIMCSDWPNDGTAYNYIKRLTLFGLIKPPMHVHGGTMAAAERNECAHRGQSESGSIRLARAIYTYIVYAAK